MDKRQHQGIYSPDDVAVTDFIFHHTLTKLSTVLSTKVFCQLLPAVSECYFYCYSCFRLLTVLEFYSCQHYICCQYNVYCQMLLLCLLDCYRGSNL